MPAGRFPCWDEPARKAVFGCHARRPRAAAAISNTAECRRATGDGRRTVRFADTIPMSTYLVAFVVGPLEVTEPVDVERHAALRVVYPPGSGHLTRFALEAGAFSLDFFADYYGIAYPATSSTWSRSPTSRSARWRTWARHVPRDAAAGRPERRHPGRAAAGRRRGRPRDRPHVVRRPRDDALVERHLAERGVRHVHGDAEPPMRSSRTGTGGPTSASSRLGGVRHRLA